MTSQLVDFEEIILYSLFLIIFFFLSILSQFCLKIALFHYCFKFVSVLSQYCFSIVSVLSQYCLSFVHILCQCCLQHYWTCRFGRNSWIILTLSSYILRYVKFFLQLLSQSFLKLVLSLQACSLGLNILVLFTINITIKFKTKRSGDTV